MLVSGEAVSIDLQPAQLASRLLSTAIDFFVSFTLAFLLLLLVAVSASSAQLDSALASTLKLLALVGGLLGYSIAMNVFCHGRTLGKIALGLRVVRDDGGPVMFRQVLIREMLGFIVEKPGPLFGVPAVVCALARQDGKRLGDLAAGTIVISERVARVGPDVAAPAMPPPLAAWASGLDLSRLPDDLALRAREVLGRASTLRPQAREELGMSITAAFARAVGPPPPGTPGWAYLSAVLAERRRRDVLRLTATQHFGAQPPEPLGPGWAPSGNRARELGTAAYDGAWAPPADLPVLADR
jgi:uncharacterized RDD family membrane protein YckC